MYPALPMIGKFWPNLEWINQQVTLILNIKKSDLCSFQARPKFSNQGQRRVLHSKGFLLRHGRLVLLKFFFFFYYKQCLWWNFDQGLLLRWPTTATPQKRVSRLKKKSHAKRKSITPKERLSRVYGWFLVAIFTIVNLLLFL